LKGDKELDHIPPTPYVSMPLYSVPVICTINAVFQWSLPKPESCESWLSSDSVLGLLARAITLRPLFCICEHMWQSHSSPHA